MDTLYTLAMSESILEIAEKANYYRKTHKNVIARHNLCHDIFLNEFFDSRD